MRTLCISIDLEPDLGRDESPTFFGVEKGIPPLLALLAGLGLSGDFFFMSSVVEAFPDLASQIVRSHHAIGNHGTDHSLLCAKPPERQLDEITRSTDAIVRALGVEPIMFRAPNFSANSATLAILARAGYKIDSSVLPGRRARLRFFRPAYDHRGAPHKPYYPLPSESSPTHHRLLEIPVAENPLRPGAPLGHGALNYYGVDGVRRALSQSPADPLVYLIHPWELVDLGDYLPDVQDDYARACSSDLSPLKDLLTTLKTSSKFLSLESVASAFEGGASWTRSR